MESYCSLFIGPKLKAQYNLKGYENDEVSQFKDIRVEEGEREGNQAKTRQAANTCVSPLEKKEL